MKIKINDNFMRLNESYLFSTVNRKAAEYAGANPDKKIIRLGIGDVTRPLTPSVIEAMQSATAEMGNGATFRGYAPEYGYDFLREAIANYYKRFGVELQAHEVFSGDGAKSDLGNLTDILGDNPILIPDPVYPVYVDSNLMCGREVSYMFANEENGFLPMPLSEYDKEGYIIYLCSPNNPTGAVYSREQLKEWVDFAINTGSLIVFDCAYEAFIREDYPHSIYEIEGARSCAIEIGSFSKMAGFTGTRCGWSVYPDELIVSDKKLSTLWARRQATKFNGIPYVVQRAAQAAISEQGIAENTENINYYLGNAKIIADLLCEKGIYYTGGINSPYIWLKCPNNMKSWEFFDYLLNTAQIIGTPGEGFGQGGEGYFRLTSFGTREATAQAVERLKAIL